MPFIQLLKTEGQRDSSRPRGFYDYHPWASDPGVEDIFLRLKGKPGDIAACVNCQEEMPKNRHLSAFGHLSVGTCHITPVRRLL